MAKLNPVFASAWVLSVVLSAVFLQLASGYTSAAAQPEFFMLPEPYAGFFNYADKCLKELSEDCGKKIYYSIFAGDSVTDGCCKMLVDMGKVCHDSILRATLALPELAKEDRFKIMAKGSEIWTKCVTGPTSNSPSESPSESLAYLDS